MSTSATAADAIELNSRRATELEWTQICVSARQGKGDNSFMSETIAAQGRKRTKHLPSQRSRK